MATPSPAPSRTFPRSRRRSKPSSARPASAKIIWKPQNTVLVDEEKAQSVMKLLDNLDNDDDVQNVFSNFEVSDEVMAKLTA